MSSPHCRSSQQPSIRHWLPTSTLGSGSFGHVSLAVNLEDGGLFAVKSTPCSSPVSAPPSVELLALENELSILLGLHCPNILRCFGADFSTQNGSPVARNLFLEYMDGGSLADLLKKSGGKLDELRVRRYTAAILEGLNYLHQNGVVHCDIKGQNILIGSSGVKIADFGAAQRLGTSSQASGPFRGTPLWMAPEVVQGVEQGPPSDIWSLGCTVVEMLQGRPPWGRTTNLAAALFKVGCSQEFPPLPDSISADAKDFLHQCLLRNPRARWTAAELLQHPFVCRLEAGGDDKSNQPSPRSTLDFHSDWEDDSTSSVPTLSFPQVACKQQAMVATGLNRASPTITRAMSSGASIPDASDWITVRRADGWSKHRQVPFMKSLEGGEAQLKKGCEVSLDSAAFLRNRKVVG